MLGKSKIKYIQSLGQKKPRDIENLFIAEGPKIVAELLSAGKGPIHEVYAVKEWIEQQKALLKNIEAVEVTADELGKISQLTTPNQVLAVVLKADIPSIDTKGTLSLVLDGIQDPGNLGTIIRIADWFGITQVICSKDCADLYNPKVVQSTMGSIVRTKVLYTDLYEWLSLQRPVPVYAAALKGQELSTIKKPEQGILIIGNESKGISPVLIEMADQKITIARKGKAESLNAAVATGIILSHLV
jgi:TrmH family RNA methyltransferase